MLWGSEHDASPHWRVPHLVQHALAYAACVAAVAVVIWLLITY